MTRHEAPHTALLITPIVFVAGTFGGRECVCRE